MATALMLSAIGAFALTSGIALTAVEQDQPEDQIIVDEPVLAPLRERFGG